MTIFFKRYCIYLLFFIAVAFDCSVNAMKSSTPPVSKIKKTTTNSICTICNKDYPKDWPGKVSICKNDKTKHTFCTPCIFGLLNEKKTKCPTCKNGIPQDTKEYIQLSYGFTRVRLTDELAHKYAQNDKFRNKFIKNEGKLRKRAVAIMEANLDKILERGEKIEELVEKTRDLNLSSKAFLKETDQGYKTSTKIIYGATAAIIMYGAYRCLKS